MAGRINETVPYMDAVTIFIYGFAESCVSNQNMIQLDTLFVLAGMWDVITYDTQAGGKIIPCQQRPSFHD